MTTLTIQIADLKADIERLADEHKTAEIVRGVVAFHEVYPRFWSALESEDFDTLQACSTDLDFWAHGTGIKLARGAFEHQEWQAAFDLVRHLKDGLPPRLRRRIIGIATEALE